MSDDVPEDGWHQYDAMMQEADMAGTIEQQRAEIEHLRAALKKIRDTAYSPMSDDTPILDCLHEERVFYIKKNPNGMFAIWEACDHYFSKELTTDELRQLGQEIINIANCPQA